MSLVTGIPLAEIHTLPFGAAIRALLYGTIVHRITTRLDLAASTGLITLLYPWAGWGYNSMFVHSLGGFLFLSLILVLLIATNRHETRHSIAAASLLIALFLFDYTASAWTGIMLVTLLVVAYFRSSLRLTSIGILGAFAAIFYTPKTTIVSYAALLQDVSPLDVFFGYFTDESTARTSTYEYVPEGSGLGLTSYFYILIALALLIYGVALGYIFYQEKSIKDVLARISTYEYIIGTALIGGGVATALYTFLDRFTQFFIFVMGPLIGVLAVWYAARHLPRIQKRRVTITVVFVVLMLGCVGAEFAYLMQTGEFDQYSDSNGEPTGAWLATHSESPTVKTDLISAGQMRMVEERHDSDFNWTWHDEESYTAVIEGGDPNPTYVVIDMESEAGVRAIGGWTRFESFGPYEERINRNSNIDRVYCDRSHCVYS
ncbi:hypothetical protein [Natronococcus wangiae]|uniref:hypothetical protein n=1 Tax=Natronococcus wangiae TaxID=3068275 RepID=UPI00273E281E|nr:hypothetical protein [Natronococcus sp. AD5]